MNMQAGQLHEVTEKHSMQEGNTFVVFQLVDRFRYKHPAPEVRNHQIEVDFVNQFWAHYRSFVMRQVSASEDVSPTWISDAVSVSTPDVPAVDYSEFRWRYSRCTRLPAGLFWQHGIVSRALFGSAKTVVYTGDPRGLATWIAAPIAKARNRRVLMWSHGWTRRDSGPIKVARLLFYRLGHGLFVYSERAVRLGREAGYEGELYAIGNSMGAQLSSRPSRNANRSLHQSWIVVSRLIAERQIQEVLRQASRLSHSGRYVRLDVVGDGPEKTALEELAASLNVECVFHGAIYDFYETAQLLRSSDILLSPGNVGLAAVHALSAGCPVATHDDLDRQGPEIESVQHGRTGVLSPRGDFNAMGDAAWSFVADTDEEDIAAACHAEVRRRWTPESHAAEILARLRTT